MTRRLRIAILLSGLGHVVHNVEEFGVGTMLIGQTLVPAAVSIAFYVAAHTPTHRYLVTLLVWGLIVVVLGGGSVFPWPFLPFVPAQTVSHDVAHLVYALLQVPVLVVASRCLRGGSAAGVATR